MCHEWIGLGEGNTHNWWDPTYSVRYLLQKAQRVLCHSQPTAIMSINNALTVWQNQGEDTYDARIALQVTEIQFWS